MTLPKGISPADYANTSVFLTPDNQLECWCNRHNKLVAVLTVGGHINHQLLGQQCECCGSEA